MKVNFNVIKRPTTRLLGFIAVALLSAGTLAAEEAWDKTFPRSEKVTHQKVTFKNRYGITLAADLYEPKERGGKRWAAETGKLELGPLYNELKGVEPHFMVDYADYYKKPRGFHPRAINSNSSWTVTNPLSFMNMPLLTHIDEISPRPILLIHGERPTLAISAKLLTRQPQSRRSCSSSRV